MFRLSDPDTVTNRFTGRSVLLESGDTPRAEKQETDAANEAPMNRCFAILERMPNINLFIKRRQAVNHHRTVK